MLVRKHILKQTNLGKQTWERSLRFKAAKKSKAVIAKNEYLHFNFRWSTGINFNLNALRNLVTDCG